MLRTTIAQRAIETAARFDTVRASVSEISVFRAAIGGPSRARVTRSPRARRFPRVRARPNGFRGHQRLPSRRSCNVVATSQPSIEMTDPGGGLSSSSKYVIGDTPYIAAT